eukprot:SAG22_NODE_27_length_29018_cov_465.809646_29_plen_102_part_00
MSYLIAPFKFGFEIGQRGGAAEVWTYNIMKHDNSKGMADKTRGEPYDVSRIIWFHPWSCQRRYNASNEKMMKTSVVSCLLQVLSDNTFLRVERRGLDHPVN